MLGASSRSGEMYDTSYIPLFSKINSSISLIVSMTETLFKEFSFASKLKASEYIYEFVKGTEPFVRRFKILKGS